MTHPDPPLVSVLLLTCNGGDRLAAVLQSVARQEAPFRFELVAVDSDSTDGSRERLAAAGARVVRITREEFNHGTTRNLGIAACRGSFVVLLVQDAEPDTTDWLARLAAPLIEDDGIAGSYARQVAPDGSGSVQRAYLSGYAAGSPGARIQQIAEPGLFPMLPAWRQLEICTFDNVCSCLRRSTWERHPFPRVAIAEDLEWAREVLLSGARLAYVPEARVRHLHDRPAAYELRRTYLVHQRLRRLFGLRTVPSSAHLARAVAVSLVRHVGWVLGDERGWTRKIAQLPRAVALAVALPLGQYLGAKSSDAGRELLNVRGV